MKRFMVAALGLLISYHAHAAGSLTIALNQQFSFSGCSTATNVCGTPLAGGLLYFFQAGTVSVRQDSFADTALTQANPWPLVLDQNGRVPMFYLCDASSVGVSNCGAAPSQAVHVRLTDSSGVVQFDYPSMLVIGPSGGGGGGGGPGVDPTLIASTGDIKFRATGETLPGWTKLNGQSIGNTGAASANLTGSQYQALFNYLWVNCAQPSGNTHCIVSLGTTPSLGTTANADWSAGKNIQLPDFRGRGPIGVDDMGNAAAGRLQTANMVGSASGDTVTTPGAWGGEAVHTMTLNDMVSHQHSPALSGSISSTLALTSDNRAWTVPSSGAGGSGFAGVSGAGGINIPVSVTGSAPTLTGSISNGTLAVSESNAGGGLPFNLMGSFILGSWYIRQ